MSADPGLGQLLRRLRSRNGWTLKQMSERSGIPVSTLSKVEHDRLTLTYDKLLQLSQRLKMPMSELFAKDEQETAPAVTARRSIGHAEKALMVTTPRYDYRYLCTDLRRKRMIPMIMTVRAKSMEDFGEMSRHNGEEFNYVVKGAIEVHTEYYDVVTLQEGESIYLDSTMGHAFLLAPGCEEAVLIGVCASAEDDLMSSLIELHGADAELHPPLQNVSRPGILAARRPA